MTETTVKVAPSQNTQAIGVAIDQIGTTNYPIYKQAFGAESSATLVSASNPLPIGFPTDGPNFDAFDRLRVSNPETLFDSKQICADNTLYWDGAEVSGSGTGSTYSANRASTVLNVSATTAGKRVRQTYMRFNYQPGKSHLVLVTGVIRYSGGGTGIVSGMGYYDDKNGLFLQDNEGTMQLVRRSYITGSAVDEAVDQTDWNLDSMDGTGPSGITLDFTKSQILLIDFEWLGVGRARMGFVVDGIAYYAHQFVHANNIVGVYMSTPNLPLRYEIENDGTGAAASIECICSSVMSEGGIEKTGTLRYVSTGAVSSLVSGTTYAMLGGKLKSTHFDISVLLEQISMAGSINDSAEWKLLINPTVAGTFTYNDVANSALQVAIGSVNNTVSGGTAIEGGYFTSASGLTVSTPNALRPGASIAGVAQAWVLAITPLSNMNAYASVTWRELL